MPTLVTVDPDPVDLDYFYENFPKSFGIGVYEETPLTSRPIPTGREPNNCFNIALRANTKCCHYFKAPITSSVVICLCGKFHTNFISQKNITYEQNSTGQTTKKSKDKKALATNIANSTEFIIPSPILLPLTAAY